MFRRAWICSIAWAALSAPVWAEARILDYPYYYLAMSTFVPAFNPALNPDMDEDGAPDLTQANLQQLADILANPAHPDHETTYDAFVHNETLARNAILTEYSPAHTFIEPVASLWGAYMTIRGGGAYMGPTLPGMAGLAEFVWNMLGFDVSAGVFAEQDWIHGAAFGGAQTVTLSMTNGGVVYEGEPVVMTAAAAGALTYRWYKDDGLIGSGGGVWDIAVAEMDDAGDYHVEVDVTGGATLETDKMTLVVTEAPGVRLGAAVWVGAGIALTLLACGAARRFGTDG